MVIVSLKNKAGLLLCYLCVFSFLFYANLMLSFGTVSAMPSEKFTVVLDAGHGGVDGGCVGASGVCESEITLKIAQKLGNYLQTLGLNVVQTRTNMDGLYGTFASGFKLRDLNKRKEIIERSKAQLVISIHLNSYAQTTAHGAQVFYKPNSEESKILATNIQKLFSQNLFMARTTPQLGDFYILNCTDADGVLCECGFLSNPEEEELLRTDEYLQKISYNIAMGVLTYYDLVKF